MTIIIPDGFAQVIYNWRSILFDSGGAVTQHGTIIDGVGLDDLAERWAQAMVTNWVEIMTPDLVLESVRLVTEDEVTEVSVLENGGSSDTSMNAPNVAVLVSEITPRRGRRGRGRMYLPGLAFDSQVTSSGVIASGYVSDLQARADTFRQGGQPGQRPMVVLQHTTPEPPNTPANPTPPLSPPPTVSDLIVSNKVASQRRRLRK